MNLIIKNGRVLDPANAIDGVRDLYVKDGVIAAVCKEGETYELAGADVIDAKGMYVMPGLIDLHVHFREPGFEYKETIETGSKSCAKGGFTGVCPMPNTKPVIDSAEMVRFEVEKAKAVSPIRIYPVGAVTMGQIGVEPTDVAAMKEAGAYAISEDGKSVMNSMVYREGMMRAKENDIVVMAHCEDKNLVGKGAINAGPVAQKIGVEGIPNAVEDIIVARDILLAKETGARLHLCHCSTADSVEMVRKAKADGVKVTAEVCPHHFSMTCDEITSDDANFKMNPPLRTKQDVQALIEGLADGTIDTISTDHAPHSAEEKERGIATAPFGIVGSETAVCLTITNLVRPGYLTPMQMAERMSMTPAKVLKVDRGTLGVGKAADITIIDPEAHYTIDASTFVSKGHNTPFNGKEVYGKVVYTIVDGNVVYKA
ncbi:MAG: dihydroorotase [Lachnospiraceae bacterium]|nr:dihydroorotase [Lachnospiraceae bacterium]